MLTKILLFWFKQNHAEIWLLQQIFIYVRNFKKVYHMLVFQKKEMPQGINWEKEASGTETNLSME